MLDTVETAFVFKGRSRNEELAQHRALSGDVVQDLELVCTASCVSDKTAGGIGAASPTQMRQRHEERNHK